MKRSAPARSWTVLLGAAALLLVACNVPIPVSPCATNNGGCDANAVCSAALGATKAVCACKAGFDGDGHSCKAVDCSSCDRNATCAAFGLGKQCICKAGYSGTGQTCTADSLCLVNNGGCGPATAGTCSATDGTVTCSCNSGYALTDGVCSDVNECDDTAACNPNATCTNTPGSFSCACNSGYSGDGHTCVTVSFCEQQPGLCGSGTCHDIPGGNYCVCPPGFDRFAIPPNTEICNDIDECAARVNPCGGGTCLNSVGGYSCTNCPDGQVYDGVTCVPDLCATDNGGCDPHADCRMSRGAVSCQCHLASPGTIGLSYFGDGLTCNVGFTSVAAGKVHGLGAATTCGIRADGSLWCWGANDVLQVGNDLSGNKFAPEESTGAAGLGDGVKTFNTISGGGGFECGVLRSGQGYCWGLGTNSRLGIALSGSGGAEAILGLLRRDWSTIAAGDNFGIGIRSNLLVAWGDNSLGQLGQGMVGAALSETLVGTQSDWLSATAGQKHACAIKIDGSLSCWGDNLHGQLGLGTTAVTSVPTKVPIPGVKWRTISAGYGATCGIQFDGSLWCWGDVTSGILGSAATADELSPVQIGTSTEWTGVSLGTNSACGTLTDRTVLCWGANDQGQLGDGTRTPHPDPEQIADSTPWLQVSVGSSYACAVSTTGAVKCWGNNSTGQLGIRRDPSNKASFTRTASNTVWTTLAHGLNHTCGIAPDSTLWCWGQNDKGQLGDGTLLDNDVGGQVGTDIDWKDVMAGDKFTCGLKMDQSLWCWGTLGGLAAATTPTLVATDKPVRALTTSSSSAPYACVISDDASLYCWGKGANYVLGNNSASDAAMPTATVGAFSFLSVARGTKFACGIRADDHSLFCWGGTGSWLHDIKVPSLFDSTVWTSVSAGDRFACGTKSDLSLWCWGNDDQGQLGFLTANVNTYAPAPASVFLPGTTWQSLSTGDANACAISATDGTLWCWGTNVSGELGREGTGLLASGPRQVGTSAWSHVYAGSRRSCAQSGEDGQLWCTGADDFGQLGDAARYSTLPRAVY
jgi:alpha-tubulin suppressor-like RCC1 family protein